MAPSVAERIETPLGDDFGRHHRRAGRAWRPSPASIRRPCRRRVSRPPIRRACISPANSSSPISAARVEPDGAVTVRAIGQQYSFTPPCILVPAETPITLRATSADVVHGILIQGTNINTMLVPGYVSEQSMRFDKTGDYLMPCQEFCSFGHEGMWGKVRVIDKAEFASARKERREAELCW